MSRIATALAFTYAAAACGERRGAVDSAEEEYVHAMREAAAIATAASDPKDAEGELAGAFDLEPPSGLAAADRAALRRDAASRIAESRFAAHDYAGALSWATRGVEVAGPADVFLADLHGIRGRALEALGRDREAAAAFEAALDVNEQLLEHVLRGQGPPRP